MQHNGGVAKDIAEIAGEAYVNECKSLISAHSGGRLIENKVYVTNNVGNLLTHKILNIAVPPCNSSSATMNVLFDAYTKCINSALDADMYSICFPLIGAGIYKWPIDQSLRQLVCSIERCERAQNNMDIYLVESDTNVLKSLLENINGTSVFSLWNIVFNRSPRPKSEFMSKFKAASNSSQKWYYIDDEGQWKEYRHDLNVQLNSAFSSSMKQTELKINNTQYDFDFEKNTQTNKLTKHTRSISNMPFDQVVQWYWYEDGNIKTAYNLEHNGIIEKEYIRYLDEQFQKGTATNGLQQYPEICIKRHRDDLKCQYLFDFFKMCQISKDTGYPRYMLV